MGQMRKEFQSLPHPRGMTCASAHKSDQQKTFRPAETRQKPWFRVRNRTRSILVEIKFGQFLGRKYTFDSKPPLGLYIIIKAWIEKPNGRKEVPASFCSTINIVAGPHVLTGNPIKADAKKALETFHETFRAG